MMLPDDDQATKLLEFCGVSAPDRDAMLAARPDPVRDAEWWAVLEERASELDRGLDQPIEANGFSSWPAMPESASPVGLFVEAWALLSRLPQLLDVHARRGVPESISRSTASALGGVMATHRHLSGRAGVGLMPLWSPPLRFRGADIEMGRHCFTRSRIALGDGPAGFGLMVHIPPIGPLDPVASEESIAAAERLFAQWYPEEPVAFFTCKSWLLDPQLAEYLDPGSNILRFQRRFIVLPEPPPDDPGEADRELMRLGLHLNTPAGDLTEQDLARVPQDTSLQRAFVAHLRSGRHWTVRTGIRLPAERGA
ncbi:acyltransferase domain-containing protein [Kribbella sp. CA-247076]|uniref:acyltransferase domain-containing protein n=1 Tax=Kribbella sp. CA-247076 TaxID=3239941 RepID=UPI003D8D364A